LKFGENIGVKVISPETMFPFEETSKMQIKPVEYQELVILMGYPGSGKTTYSKIFEDAGYFIVHGDEHKLIKKMIKVGEDAIKNEKSVVFDATNATREKRAVYVELAKKYNLPVRCIFVNTSLEQSIMRNNLREKPVPKIVYNIYNKNFEEPSEDEGFVLIKTE
jgi:bifunctional polynucleotide phosphatase/kinase